MLMLVLRAIRSVCESHTDFVQFEDRLKALRPGTSIDYRRWSLRGEQLMRQRSFNDVSTTLLFSVALHVIYSQ